MPQNFHYAAPRAAAIVLAWGVAYWLLTRLSTHVAPAVVYTTAIAWALGGAAGFIYIRKLYLHGPSLADPPRVADRRPN